jgi:hypothetical protein
MYKEADLAVEAKFSRATVRELLLHSYDSQRSDEVSNQFFIYIYVDGASPS